MASKATKSIELIFVDDASLAGLAAVHDFKHGRSQVRRNLPTKNTKTIVTAMRNQ